MSNSKKKNTRKHVVITTIVMVIVAAVVIGVFYYISNDTKSSDKEAITIPKNEMEKLEQKDLDTDYPATPNELMKLYSRYSKIFYVGNLSDAEIKRLIVQYRKLLDDELLENNLPLGEHLKSLKKEIAQFKSDNQKITNYIVKPSSEVKYFKKDGRECAGIQAEYLINNKQGYSKLYEQFILRKDSSNRWKILGWQADKSEASDDKKSK